MKSSTFTYRLNQRYLAVFDPLYIRPLYLEIPTHSGLEDMAPINKRDTILLLNQMGLPSSSFDSVFSSCHLFRYTQEERQQLLAELIQEEKGFFKAMFLMVDGSCNLSCTYCFTGSNVLGNKWSGMKLVREKADKAVDFFIRNMRQDSPNILVFYGGEPLLNWPLVEHLAEHVYNLNCYGKGPGLLSCRLVTNGILLDDGKIRKIGSLGVTVVLSLGDAAIVNGRMSFADSKWEYSNLQSTINILQQRHVDTILSVLLTPTNIDSLQGLVAWLEGVNLPFMLNVVKDTANFQTSIEFKQQASKSIIEAYAHTLRGGLVDNRLHEILSCIRQARPYLQDCYAQGAQQIVVRPDATLGMCQGFINEDRFFKPITVETAEIEGPGSLRTKEWQDRSILGMMPCQRCEAQGVCGGGCPQQAALRARNLHDLDIRYCMQARNLIKWLLQQVLSNNELCDSFKLPKPFVVRQSGNIVHRSVNSL